ncbi:unnamed protein product, partial [Phaeothamnion confervicola]
ERDPGRYLGPGVYFHDVFVAGRGSVVRFVLQIDIWEDGIWRPVIRCDTSHGEAHLDEITPEGKTYIRSG